MIHSRLSLEDSNMLKGESWENQISVDDINQLVLFTLHASHGVNNNSQVFAWEPECRLSDLAGPWLSFHVGSDGISQKANFASLFNNL